MKEFYPEDWYDVFKERHLHVEKLINDPDLHWHFKDKEYWNRFLWYMKAGTEDPAQLLPIYMISFNYDKHHFCEHYNRIMPRLINGKDNEYLKTYYKNEMPIMDSLCAEVLNSYDKTLIQQIEKIEQDDQQIRSLIGETSFDELKKSGQWQKQVELDAKNLRILEEIIQKYGYPGRAEVGRKNEMIAFLVIQHSGLEIIEKYLPLVEKAIEEKNLRPTVYPYLYDRMKILKGLPQYYGTQYELNNPEKLIEIEDIAGVNERRKKYALPAMK